MHRLPKAVLRLTLLSLTRCCLSQNPVLADTATVHVSLDSPRDFQVFQRQSRRGGIVKIEGTASLSTAANTARLEARFVPLPVPSSATNAWVPVEVDARVPRFRAEIEVLSGGWYQLEMRATVGSESFGVARIDHVGMGEIFIVAGQSNSANHGETRQQPATDKVVAMKDSQWQVATDPQPGASGNGGSFLPALGDALYQHFGVPIGFVAMGSGGTSVREWLPAGTPIVAPPTTGANTITVARGTWVSSGTLYDHLVDRTRALGFHGFRAVLWHQGESDNHQPDGRNITPEQYENYLRELIRHDRLDCGWSAPWFVAQASYHVPSDPGSPELRAAQRAVASNGFAIPGPNTDDLGEEFREDDGRGVHFNGRGLIRHAELWAQVLIPWLEGQLQ